MYQNLTILALFVFLYSIVSARVERTPINGALVFSLFGLAMGPFGLNLLQLSIDAEGLRILAELTLALVLFCDAANADLSVLKRTLALPGRLLLLALPLIIVLGFVIGLLLFDQLTWVEVALLAILLAPTDAALGKAVVTDKRVPQALREGLNVESGLNDGICVPILFTFLALAIAGGQEESPTLLALHLVVEEIGIGAVVGLGLTFVCSWLFKQLTRKHWVNEIWQQLPVPTLALACFCMAQWLGGSGFIACFAGGMLFGKLAKQQKHDLLYRTEGSSDLLALLTWVAFGAAVVGQAMARFSWEVLLYAVLSLTLIRMLPVFLALWGLPMTTGEKLFTGWFGPRGLASVVFAVIVLNEQLPGGETIALTATFTIGLSILAHGLSANPLCARLADAIKRRQT